MNQNYNEVSPHTNHDGHHQKRAQTLNAGEDVQKGNPTALLVGNKLMQHLRRIVWRFLNKLGIKLPYDPAIPLLGMYPEKTTIQKDTCILMFFEALFTKARTWTQPRCSLTDEWTTKMQYIYIHTKGYYSDTQRN